MTSSDRWRRIEEIFQAAIDMPPRERDGFLRDTCGEDAGLRLEVESLLASDIQGPPAISQIIQGTAASLLDVGRTDAIIGAKLGNYRITGEIGRGGMGAVYLAVRADDAFEKQVAIKLVKRGIDTDAVLQRFWYERRILAGLEHPYIARLLDGGTSPDGRPYFVMEYVEGKPLDVYVRSHGLSIGERCDLFRKVCEAVSYAHRNLIIHRDLKPANILVTADGTPKLLDFGIARLLSAGPGQQTIVGPGSGYALTPEFASPEQVRGEAVTTATDVFSLGATFRAILPSDARIPADLTTIVGKAMREEIDQRFASVADLSEDLRRYLAGLPILAREQTLTYQAGKFVRRHRVGMAVLALAMLLVMVGMGGILWESRRADFERREAEQRLSQAVDMADRTLKEVNSSIASLPGTTEARRQMVRSTLEYLDRLAKDSGNDRRVLMALATAYMRVGEVLGNPDFPNLGDLQGSLGTYQKAIDVITGLLAKTPGDRKLLSLASTAHQGRGSVLSPLGRDNDAQSEYRIAIDFAARALAQRPEDPELQYQNLDAHYALDMALYSSHPDAAGEDAREQLPVAVKLAAQQPGDLDRQNKLSEIYSLLGTVANRFNRLDESLSYYRKAAEVREAVYRQHPRNTKIQRNLMIGYGHIGDVLGNPFTGCLGDYQGALGYYQKAATIAEDMKLADPSDKRAGFDVGMIWIRIGATRQAAGDPKGSNDALDRAIGLIEPLMTANPLNAAYARAAAIAYEYRGRDAWMLGDRAGALNWYRKSLAMTHGTDMTARAQQLAAEGPMAVLLAMNGDRDGAIRIAERLVELGQEFPNGRRDFQLAKAWGWYANTYEALHEFARASQAYAKSAAAWKAVIGGSVIPPYEAQMQAALQHAAVLQSRAARH